MILSKVYLVFQHRSGVVPVFGGGELYLIPLRHYGSESAAVSVYLYFRRGHHGSLAEHLISVYGESETLSRMSHNVSRLISRKGQYLIHGELFCIENSYFLSVDVDNREVIASVFKGGNAYAQWCYELRAHIEVARINIAQELSAAYRDSVLFNIQFIRHKGGKSLYKASSAH